MTGTEDLGGGLSALFNLEAAMDIAVGNAITGGANSGTLIAQPATTSFWRRNSYVGLKSARKIKMAAAKLPKFSPGVGFKAAVDPKAAARKAAKAAATERDAKPVTKVKKADLNLLRD